MWESDLKEGKDTAGKTRSKEMRKIWADDSTKKKKIPKCYPKRGGLIMREARY